MAVRMRDEVRALSDDELELVVQTHIPLVLDLSDGELRALLASPAGRDRRTYGRR